MDAGKAGSKAGRDGEPEKAARCQRRQKMTPQERQLVTELFDRLASLENHARDGEAERAIGEGLARAPHAVYALVQTVLVQDEALKRADARIQEIEGAEAPRPGFLDSMRETMHARDERRGSVPSVRPGAGWSAGQAAPPPQGAQEGVGRGSSFLGTAAATAAGVIGGGLLFSAIQSLMGGHRGASGEEFLGERRAPWGDEATRSDLAREAGLNDVGGQRAGALEDSDRNTGLFDNDNDVDFDDEALDDFAVDGDLGDGDA